MSKWHETQQGQQLGDGWYSIRKLLCVWLPAHYNQALRIKNRSIRG